MDVSTTPGPSRLSEAEVTFFLVEHGEWHVADGMLVRTFEFESFAGAVGFVTAIAIEAEAMNHHPDVDIRWNKVRIGLTTHDAGGVTTLDTRLATVMDVLAG